MATMTYGPPSTPKYFAHLIHTMIPHEGGQCRHYYFISQVKGESGLLKSCTEYMILSSHPGVIQQGSFRQGCTGSHGAGGSSQRCPQKGRGATRSAIPQLIHGPVSRVLL